MKLKRNCLFFNAKTNEQGRTPDWGQELGQGKGYLMKIDGCSDIINGLVYNQILDLENFSYGSGGGKYEIQIVSLFRDVNIKIYDFQKKIHLNHKLNNSLILIIAKEIEGTHKGRRTLKMNKDFRYESNSNLDFFNEINDIIPEPWFGYDLDFDFNNTGQLTLTILKDDESYNISSSEIIYNTAKERKNTWDLLVQEYNNERPSENSENIDNNYLIKKNLIFYGSPGTGKSHKVNELVSGKEDRVERVTFHPDFDYFSFVGGYKPSMKGDDIIYEFIPQSFIKIYVKAWNDPENDYYLIIEEINRGNCGEIFGDIFQLLDRDNNYSISTSKELSEFLSKHLINQDYIGCDKLLLPPNLNLIATMNTSDQSLYPMDSAFKRRWDWNYIPVNYEFTSQNKSSKFKIQITDDEYFSWLEFLKSINTLIKENTNLGMDKCIGNYFINPKDNIITIDTFINKVIFYLWNDVFKEEFDDNNIFTENTTFEEFFPINTSGIFMIKNILSSLNVEIYTSELDEGFN